MNFPFELKAYPNICDGGTPNSSGRSEPFNTTASKILDVGILAAKKNHNHDLFIFQFQKGIFGCQGI